MSRHSPAISVLTPATIERRLTRARQLRSDALQDFFRRLWHGEARLRP